MERLAVERVSGAVAGLGLPRQTIDRLGSAVAEATMNAMEHGNRYRPELKVAVQVLMSAERLTVRISDKGTGRVDIGGPVPNLEAKLRGEESARGWGLYLIRSLVDEVHATSHASGHVLELVIRLTEGRRAE